VERVLGVKLFERSATGITPTPAGLRYYRRCVEAVGLLETAAEEMRAFAGYVTGDLRIGLIPTFTRAALAPTLEKFVPHHPDIRLHIVEGYSSVLTEMVLADELDFAVVPTFEGRTGLTSRLVIRSREMLLSGSARGFKRLAPVRLQDCIPLKLVVPRPDNVRRRNLEIYLQTHGLEVAEMIEMDAMIGTLEFVARTDWLTVLPGLICVNDIKGGKLVVNPIDPPLFAEFVAITPARRPLSTQARLFLQQFEAEVAHIEETWRKALAAHPSAHPRLHRKAEARHRRRALS
jgi:LysR family transcriptional regulator, nitrogen assimilation regulatory protein